MDYPILDFLSDDEGPPSVHSIESDQEDNESSRIKNIIMKKTIPSAFFKKLEPEPYEPEGIFFS